MLSTASKASTATMKLTTKLQSSSVHFRIDKRFLLVLVALDCIALKGNNFDKTCARRKKRRRKQRSYLFL